MTKIEDYKKALKCLYIECPAAVADDVKAKVEAKVKELERENRHLRRMFAHCYAGTALYHDDGELQDISRTPFIDFKRDDIDIIELHLAKRVEAKAK